MTRGTIVRLRLDGGYGFLAVDGRRDDVFFHRSVVSQDGRRFEDLVEGDTVAFEEELGPRGPRATSVLA